MKSYLGQVKGRFIEVRFPFSGKISSFSKAVGDKVKKWEFLASLDTKILQTELDKQLNDYNKVRAEFEIFRIEGNKNGDVGKFLQTQKQASLDTSVKEVELAKQKLDQASLFSPIEGVIVEADGLIPGLNVTPSNAVIKILDTNSLYFTFEITQKELERFTSSLEIKVKLTYIDLDIKAKSNPVIFGENGKFEVTIPLPSNELIIPGLHGEAVL